LTLNPVAVEKLIGPKTRAVMFVGFGGNVGNLKQISELCKTYNLKLILDAAHMSGTRYYNGTHVGKEVDVSVFSFHSVKNLPIADGGMICFNNPELDSYCRKLTWLGINKDTFSRSNKEIYKWQYDVEDVGFKYHGNSILAAIGLIGLKYLAEDNAYRRVLSSLYDIVFEDSTDILCTIKHSNCVSSRHLYQILVANRDELITKLNARDVYPGVHYITNTNYKMYSYDHTICPVANTVSDHILSLPLHLHLQTSDVKKIGTIVKEILNEEVRL
jgi:dTDP-4-amino-4,6-dideoxygalactose transaminase